MNKLSKMPVTCMFSLLIIAILVNNSFKRIAIVVYLPKKSSVSIRFDKNRHTEDFQFRYCPLNST